LLPASRVKISAPELRELHAPTSLAVSWRVIERLSRQAGIDDEQGFHTVRNVTEIPQAASS
jgi:hypothetical protein